MDIKEIFAARIIELRREKGISQAQLAELVGVSKTSANLYESASRVPDIQVLARYAKELDVTADYLIGLTDNRTAENALVGSQLGLWDETIAQLKYYVEVRECLKDIDKKEIDEDALDVIDSMVQNGRLGRNEEEIGRNIANIFLVLNLMSVDVELLMMLHNYYFEDYSGNLNEFNTKDRDSIALLKIVKHLINNADTLRNPPF